MGYRTERISRKNLKDLIPIFQAAFNEVKSEAELIRKYDTSFSGQSYVGFIAYSEIDGAPAAYYGVFPLQAKISGVTQLIAQSGDTMTDPAHQGKGLFVMLANRTYELCRELGIKAVFGFPSASSYGGFTKKLNWQHKLNIENFSFGVPTLPVSLLLQYDVTKTIYLKWVNFVLRKFEVGKRFPGLDCSLGNDCIPRTKEYWEYKLRNSKNRCLRIRNNEVVLKLGVTIGVGDVNIKNQLDLLETIKGIRKLAFFLGVPQFRFYTNPGTALSEYMNANFKAQKGLAIGYLNLDIHTDISGLKYSYFDFDTF